MFPERGPGKGDRAGLFGSAVILHKRMHLGENVPRNAPRARNEDDRGEADEMEDDGTGWEGRSADATSRL